MMPIEKGRFVFRADCGCRVVFSGTTNIALPSLDACHEHRHDAMALSAVVEVAKKARNGGIQKPSQQTRRAGK